MIPVWGYAAAGGAVVLLLGWRTLNRFRVRRCLRASLRSLAETERRVAVRECVAIGVTETARMLVRHIQREQSRRVLDELVIALAERQWEPASKTAVMQLRMWAHGYAIDHPEVLATGATGAAGAAGSPAEHEEDERAGQGAGSTAVESALSPPYGSPLGLTIAPTTVLVTQADSPAAVATIRELTRLGHRVIAVDDDRLSAGLRLADVGEVVPSPDEPGFPVCLVQLSRAHGVAVMVCTTPAVQDAIQVVGDELTAAGVRWALPRLDAVHACTAKRGLGQNLNDNGLPTPEHVSEVDEPGIREFAADVLAAAEGQPCGIVTHWRLGAADGLHGRAETFNDPHVSEVCVRAVKTLRLTGPASVLGYLTANGEVRLVDVHPYFSAGLSLSLHAGADLVGQHLRQIFGLPVLAERLTAEPGLIMTREVHETFEE